MAASPWGPTAAPTSKNPWGTANAQPWKPTGGLSDAARWEAAASGLSPEDVNFYNTAFGRADFSYLQSLDQNRHNRASARIGFEQSEADMKERFRGQREQVYGQLAARGVGQSPYGRQQYLHFENESNRAMAALKQQYLQQLSGLTIADQQLINSRNQNYLDIHNAKAAKRAAAAIIKNNAGGF